jgi:hypothetical protein
VRPEGLGELKELNDSICTRTRYLPACSIVPQLTTLPRAPEQTTGPKIEREAANTLTINGLILGRQMLE